MLKTLIQGMMKLSDRRTRVDPSRFHDPLAEETSWDPLKSGGTNFCTRRLVDVGAHRVEFRATTGAMLFYLAFLLMGLGALVFLPKAMASQGASGGQVLMPLLIGLGFTVVGGCMYFFGTTPIVFDRGSNHYWRGRISPDVMPDRHAADNWADLEEIYALQIVSEWCRGSGKNQRSYYSYELNLVLSNGDRLNVVDHGNAQRLRKDAARLARFLDVPVWDAT